MDRAKEPAERGEAQEFLPGRLQEMAIAYYGSQVLHAAVELEVFTRLSEPFLDFSGARNLLDIGGGSGGMAIAFGEHYPQLEITLFDMPLDTRGTLLVDPPQLLQRLHGFEPFLNGP